MGSNHGFQHTRETAYRGGRYGEVKVMLLDIYNLWMWARRRLWYSGRSSWLQIQRSGFDSLRYEIFKEVVGLERGPFSLVSTLEELFGRKSSGFGLESREYDHGDLSRRSRGTLYTQKLAQTSPTSGGTLDSGSRIQAKEFSSFPCSRVSTQFNRKPNWVCYAWVHPCLAELT
jgi:hypothetical protein